jgi:hypothetical protein
MTPCSLVVLLSEFPLGIDRRWCICRSYWQLGMRYADERVGRVTQCSDPCIAAGLLKNTAARLLCFETFCLPIEGGQFFFPMARQPLGSLGRLIFRGFTITHFFDTPHSVGLLWTRDQPVAETST